MTEVCFEISNQKLKTSANTKGNTINHPLLSNFIREFFKFAEASKKFMYVGELTYVYVSLLPHVSA